MWKSMKMEEKSKYIDMARQAVAEHRKKYPGK
jgi:AMMECR1 domain-containing protein